MDLNDINLEERADAGAVLELTHPVTKEPLLNDGKPITITLAGSDSAAYRKKQREIQARKINALAKGKKVENLPTDEERAELLGACTQNWSGIVVGGVALDCSYEAAQKLYLERGWIREQVDAFIGERANFFPS